MRKLSDSLRQQRWGKQGAASSTEFRIRRMNPSGWDDLGISNIKDGI